MQKRAQEFSMLMNVASSRENFSMTRSQITSERCSEINEDNTTTETEIVFQESTNAQRTKKHHSVTLLRI